MEKIILHYLLLRFLVLILCIKRLKLNRTNEFNTDTSNNYFPRIQPLLYQGDAQNYSILNNPAEQIQNLDMASQRTYIKPFYTTKEQFGSVLPIEVNNSILPLGPIYIKKTVLTTNDNY